MSLSLNEVKYDVIKYSELGYPSREISKIMGISKSSINDFLAKKTHKEFWEQYTPVASGTIKEPDEFRGKLKGKRFVFTSAQNNTYLHERFWSALQHYCNFNEAELYVSTFHYNKSGFQNGTSGDIWYDPKIANHLLDHAVEVADGLVFCGELNILPTAVNPLSGLQTYTKTDSAIIPHAKVALQSVPRAKGSDPKFLYTTGAVTLRNYVQMKAGQKASFHHVFGALVVEVDDEGDWFVRQLNAEDDGSFYDLLHRYTANGVESVDRVLAVNWGDIHAEKIDEEVANVSFGDSDESILDVLKPSYQFVHDVMDFTSRNHHNIGDHYFRFKSYVSGQDLVANDLYDTGNVLQGMNRDFCETVVVESNHNQALEKWLKNADYRNDPANAVTFLELQLAAYKAMERGMHFNPLEHALCESHELINTVFLRVDDSYVLEGIEFGSHGHLGNNGGRGSIQAYRVLGNKYNIGHSHSAAIADGVYQAGTCSQMDMGYNVGNTSWSHSHIITYPDGKRQIITIRNGKWRA